ncbi:DUF58 domain-containing protein [Dactylosporangium sp. CA-233914]|uniref:DUF58 domain-containing protein n=1 Tax=Dactylosporangium sp. CA-233914 TaxID=3239934 RepID=UPI003D8B224D
MATAADRLLRRLEWQVVRRLEGQLQGSYRTVFRGTGIDFADLREYTPEDDVRHIDWNVTARLDEPFVRQYTEDRELTAWLVLDLSASMRFGARSGPVNAEPHRAGPGAGEERGKDSTLTELAVSLARLLTYGGNRVGAVLYDNARQLVLPPRSGRQHVLRLAHEIERGTSRTPEKGATDLGAMLRLAASTARRRSLVFVVSDFIGEDWEAELTRLTFRHEVVAIRVVDPVELDLPDLGLVVVEDAETGEQILVDTGDPQFRLRLRAEVDAREAAVAEAMRRCGVRAHVVSTAEDPLQALVAMVRDAKRRRR